MKRPDLPSRADVSYDGWQALDATPQESSEGDDTYRLLYEYGNYIDTSWHYRDTSLPRVTLMLMSVNISTYSYNNIFIRPLCLDQSDSSKMILKLL